LLLRADVLAATQILLYVGDGGVHVLMLFAIMLVDADARVAMKG